MLIKDRIEYLDGLRGLAILLVIGFHAYSRWPEIVPYGNRFSNIPIFKAGWLGVQLFFMISGFVILLTLEKCASIKEFIYRRWIRLFPAMLICSLFIFFTAPYFHERPAGTPSIESMIPGLTFIEPSWLKFVFGFHTNPLEGAFWSIYVEFKFYIFAACIYFWKGQKCLVKSLLVAYMLSIFFMLGNATMQNIIFNLVNNVFNELSFNHFGWFAAGSAFYIFSKNHEFKWFLMALCSALLSSAFVSGLNWKYALVACIISLFFSISVLSQKLQWLLSRRFLMIFGVISYPLYLLHENMMISMIIKLGTLNTVISPVLYPIVPVIVISTLSYFISIYWESYIKKLVVNFGWHEYWIRKPNTILQASDDI